MPQNPNEYTMSSSIMSTNFAPRFWGAIKSLKEFRDKPMTVSWFEDFLVTYDLS